MAPSIEAAILLPEDSYPTSPRSMVPIDLGKDGTVTAGRFLVTIREMIEAAQRSIGNPEVKFLVVQDVLYIFPQRGARGEIYHDKVLESIRGVLGNDRTMPQAGGRIYFSGDFEVGGELRIYSSATSIFGEPQYGLSEDSSNQFLQETLLPALPGIFIFQAD